VEDLRVNSENLKDFEGFFPNLGNFWTL